MSFYFDNAATTFPKPECVYDFMNEFYRKNGGNAGRGQYKIVGESQKIIFETRKNLQELLNCKNKDIIFTPTATIALNMIIQGVLEKKEYETMTVYISPFEHNSVTRVLHHFEEKGQIVVRELFVNSSFEFDLEKIEFQFEKENPDFVIISHASNVIGLIAPVLEIFSLAKKFECITLTDMAQTAALVPLDVGNDLIDFAVFEGHKTLYGPFGAAGFAKSKLVKLEPVLFGGTGIDSENQNMPDVIPEKYEMGSLNIHAISGLYAATKWFLNNQDEIRSKEKENHHRLLEILNEFDFIEIIGPENRFCKKTECIGVVSSIFEKYSPEEIGNVFDEKDVSVRTGLHCSPIAHKFLKTFPAGTVRFSTGYFTSEEDFDALTEALEYIKRNI